MRTNTRVPQALALALIFLLSFNYLPPISMAAPPDNPDGIWTDDFGANNTTIRGPNCCWDPNGFIRLNESSVGGRIYNYVSGSNYAGYYRSIFPFFPSPTRRTGIEFNRDFGYLALQAKNEEQNQYVSTSTTVFQHYVVHLFRFKLDASGESVGDVIVNWTGKADNPGITTIYYWKNYAHLPLGRWISLQDSTDETINFNITVASNDTKLAVGTDHFFNVLVVLKSPGGTLSTDYVYIKNTGEVGYVEGPATVTSLAPIEPQGNKPYYEAITWDAYQSEQYPLIMQVLVKNSTGTLVLIPEDILPGNAKGFTTSPIYLDNLTAEAIDAIYLRATLSTKDSSRTPELYSWTVTWQHDAGRWQDRFTSEFRIDTNQYINWNPGYINLSTIQGKWPMVGQNPANTRVAEGRGPVNGSLYWFSAIHENSSIAMNAPILDGDSLYITFTNPSGGHVYRYRPVVKPSGMGSAFWKNHTIEFSGYGNELCVVSPAIMDNSLIVATGTTGGVTNKICFFNKNNIAQTPVNYTSNVTLSFWASPIVVDKTIYITAWSGDFDDPDTNSRLLALHFENNVISSAGVKALPAWSFSTPAYSDNIVVAGCHNTKAKEPSIFAYNTNDKGDIMNERWNASVGAIDRASPVIANGVVYIVSEAGSTGAFSDQTQITAIDLYNGTILWGPTTIGEKVATPLRWDANNTLADCTPAYFDGNLYVATPDGQLLAISDVSGTVKWPKTVYTYRRLLNDPIMRSSPTIASDVIYFGTPAGNMVAYNISGTESWTQKTYGDTTIPVVTSPVVSNGLVYFASANGWIYSYGSYIAPTDKLSGTLISIPIRLPQNYWWSKFFVEDNVSSGKNNITYSLLDENNNLLRSLKNGDVLTAGNVSIPRTVRLKAYFQAKNLTVNPALKRWNLTFSTDSKRPYFVRSSLQPPVSSGGWVNTIYSEFRIQAKDNDTGLLVSSARFRVDYFINATAYNVTHAAACTGSNGTKEPQNFTANLSQWPEFKNITQLKSVTLTIMDLAGNTAELYLPFRQDTFKPTSKVTNALLLKKTYRVPFYINVTATDNLSGIHNITLLYRVSTTETFSGPWIPYETKNASQYSWRVTLPTGGFYQIMTSSTDNAGNNESLHTVPDANLTFDDTAPDIPDFQPIYWFNETPRLSVTFTDDFRLDTIQYKPEFITGDWITIASHINQSSYTAQWTLPEEYWDEMQSNESNYLYFRINDTLGNTRTINDPANALELRRDTDKPTVMIEVPSQETFHNTGEHFNITARASDLGSGIQSVKLEYQYSATGNNWTGEWVQYGQSLTAPPYTWDFGAGEGEGYYQFRIIATDHAGNTAESGVISAGIQTFPTEWLALLGVLVAILIIISIILLLKWKKR